jgi:hypothetical protein
VYVDREFKVIKNGQGGSDIAFMAFMDPSPQLPSEMVANHMLLGAQADEELPVLLLREKVSKLSESLTLAKSIFMVVKRNSQNDEQEITKTLAVKTVSLKS